MTTTLLPTYVSNTSEGDESLHQHLQVAGMEGAVQVELGPEIPQVSHVSLTLDWTDFTYPRPAGTQHSMVDTGGEYGRTRAWPSTTPRA